MKNKGLHHERTKFNPLEKALADLWEKENDHNNRRHINYGYGILQDLFLEDDPKFGRIKMTCHHNITEKERYVAATLIQWLGTNCGMAFLREAFEKVGFKIERKN